MIFARVVIDFQNDKMTQANRKSVKCSFYGEPPAAVIKIHAFSK